MSIDGAALLSVATDAFAAVIDAQRRSGEHRDPGILYRIGKLDAALVAARAAGGRGKLDEAASLASGVLRAIAQDFPEQARLGIAPANEDRLRRSIAADALQSEVAS